MGWYTVTKTIKGRGYIYRQRTYRQGGKVRTESHYVGPTHDEAGQPATGSLDVSDADASEAQAVPIRDRSLPPPPSLRIEKQVRHRTDLSEYALWAEEEHACRLMKENEITYRTLPAIRLRAGREVRIAKLKDGYAVYGPLSGRRNAYKKAYRTALGLRWLDQLKTQHPTRYDDLRFMVDMEVRWLARALSTQSPWYAFLINWFTGREPWREEAAEILGEMIQHGSHKTYQHYYKQAVGAEKAAQRELRKFEKLVQPKARRRQYAKYKRAKQNADRLAAKHSMAMWTRVYVFQENPEGNTLELPS